jgi:homoserine O-acetyltransferase/O-succinyltransferase
MQAMLTYRSHASFEERFGSTRTKYDGNTLAAHSYLRYQAEKFTKRFDATCYLSILNTMDTHDLFRGRSEECTRITQPCLVIGVHSDCLFPPVEQGEIFCLCSRLDDSELIYLDSQDGHDGFLLEFKQLSELIKSFMCKHLPEDLTDNWAVVSVEIEDFLSSGNDNKLSSSSLVGES